MITSESLSDATCSRVHAAGSVRFDSSVTPLGVTVKVRLRFDSSARGIRSTPRSHVSKPPGQSLRFDSFVTPQGRLSESQIRFESSGGIRRRSLIAHVLMSSESLLSESQIQFLGGSDH